MLRSLKEGKKLKVKRLSASSKIDLQTKAGLCLGLNFQHPLKDGPVSSSDYLIPWTNQCQSFMETLLGSCGLTFEALIAFRTFPEE